MFTNLCCWYILNESIKQEKSILENQDKKTEKKKNSLELAAIQVSGNAEDCVIETIAALFIIARS